MKIKDLIKLLEKDGWFLVRIKGSHRQYKHNTKLGLTTVPGKLSDDIAIGTYKSILKQSGLSNG